MVNQNGVDISRRGRYHSMNHLDASTRISPKGLAQRGGLGPYCGEVLPTLHLLFEPRPKLPAQYRIVAAWRTHSCPLCKILAVEVFDLGGRSTIERGDNAHCGWVHDQAEYESVDSAFAGNWEIRNRRVEITTHCLGRKCSSVVRWRWGLTIERVGLRAQGPL